MTYLIIQGNCQKKGRQRRNTGDEVALFCYSSTKWRNISRVSRRRYNPTTRKTHSKNSNNTIRRTTYVIWRIFAVVNIPLSPKLAEDLSNWRRGLTLTSIKDVLACFKLEISQFSFCISLRPLSLPLPGPPVGLISTVAKYSCYANDKDIGVVYTWASAFAILERHKKLIPEDDVAPDDFWRITASSFSWNDFQRTYAIFAQRFIRSSWSCIAVSWNRRWIWSRKDSFVIRFC